VKYSELTSSCVS